MRRSNALTNAYIMNAMVDNAIDAKLAQQIFDAVASLSVEMMMVRAKGGMAPMLYYGLKRG